LEWQSRHARCSTFPAWPGSGAVAITGPTAVSCAGGVLLASRRRTTAVARNVRINRDQTKVFITTPAYFAIKLCDQAQITHLAPINKCSKGACQASVPIELRPWNHFRKPLLFHSVFHNPRYSHSTPRACRMSSSPRIRWPPPEAAPKA
jgi:hypothetical protein